MCCARGHRRAAEKRGEIAPPQMFEPHCRHQFEGRIAILIEMANRGQGLCDLLRGAPRDNASTLIIAGDGPRAHLVADCLVGRLLHASALLSRARGEYLPYCSKLAKQN